MMCNAPTKAFAEGGNYAPWIKDKEIASYAKENGITIVSKSGCWNIDKSHGSIEKTCKKMAPDTIFTCVGPIKYAPVAIRNSKSWKLIADKRFTGKLDNGEYGLWYNSCGDLIRGVTDRKEEMSRRKKLPKYMVYNGHTFKQANFKDRSLEEIRLITNDETIVAVAAGCVNTDYLTKKCASSDREEGKVACQSHPDSRPTFPISNRWTVLKNEDLLAMSWDGAPIAYWTVPCADVLGH